MDRKKKIKVVAGAAGIVLLLSILPTVFLRRDLFHLADEPAGYHTDVYSEEPDDSAKADMDKTGVNPDEDENSGESGDSADDDIKSGQTGKSGEKDNSGEAGNSDEITADLIPRTSIYEVKLEDLTETEITTPTDFSEQRYPLLACIPEKDISLFAADDGVILRHENQIKTFVWAYLTPRFILPRMWMDDFDRDGVEEILCVLYVGSGTGVAIEELHILEPDETEIYRDILFSPEDYIKQLEDKVAFKYDKEKNKLYFTTMEADYEYDAPELFAEDTFYSIGYGWIIYFTYEDGILLEADPSFSFEEFAAPAYFYSVQAKVDYWEESFTITDISVRPLQY